MTLQFRLCGLAVDALCPAANPAWAETLLVGNPNVGGDGSLQAMLDAAAASTEATTILTPQDSAGMVTATGPTYAVISALSVFGTGLTIASTANVTFLAATGTERLSLDGISFEGPGGIDSEIADGIETDGAEIDAD